MELGVEAHQVGAQQAEEDLLLPGADAEGLEVRPRNVPEEGDARVRARLLDELGQQREMVVLHQDDRPLGLLHLLDDRGGEMRVHRAVLLPVVGTELRALVHDVTERPQPLVGEAVVVAGLLLLGEPHAAQRVDADRGSAGRCARPPRGRRCRCREPPTRRRSASMIGSSAVTRPLAGCCSTIARPTRTWLTGSRLDTMKIGRSPNRISTNCLSRSSVHRLSPRQPQPRLLGGRQARAGQRAGQAGDLGGQRAEEALVGVGGRRQRLARLELPRPLGDPRHRSGDRPAHDQPGDTGQQEHQHAEADGGAPPQVPLAQLEELGVEQARRRRRSRAPPAAAAPRTPASAGPPR